MSIKQHCILLFALLAFVGQSVAAVHASCSAMDVADNDVPMEHMDHSMHGMQDQNAETGVNKPCCGDLDCAMVQCGILFSAIVDNDVLQNDELLSEPVINSGSSYTSSYAISLFRPPISH